MRNSLAYWLPVLLLVQPVAVQAQAATPVPHAMLVRGMAERELEPEKLDVLMTYHFSDNVKESERTQGQEEALRQVLRRAGIADDKLLLEDLAASGYGGFSKVGNANVALTKTYRLTLDNPQQLNTLVPQLVQTGADNLRFVNLQSNRRPAALAELATQAGADARQKATLAVKAAGAQLGTVLTMVEVLPGQQYSPQALDGVVFGNRKAKASRASDDPVEIDTPNLRKIKLVVVYDVVFEVKP